MYMMPHNAINGVTHDIINGVTHDTINGAVDHDENLVRNLSSAASKVNNSTGGARKKH